jgi:uncharacterized protein (DUF1786 family)
MDHPHDHDHETLFAGEGNGTTILAIDVGAGTQDILLYESNRRPENCTKLVLPSQTQIVAKRVREATAAGKPIHLIGTVMGGGASSDAIKHHLEHGYRVTATASAARTIHNNPERVRALGVEIDGTPSEDAVVIELADIDLAALLDSFERFDLPTPDRIAVAIQDHGYRPGRGNNDVRFDYLQSLLENGGRLGTMIFTSAPPAMTRMDALLEAIPGAYVMDTGAAAVLGSLGDPVVANAARETGAVLVNIGNMHTFATLVKGDRLYGLFEHHTSGMTPALLGELVARLQAGEIDPTRFAKEFDAHGAAFDPSYRNEMPFPFVAITGPNRGIARELDYHEAAPHGDMMLTGSFGLVEGVLMSLETGETLIAS